MMIRLTFLVVVTHVVVWFDNLFNESVPVLDGTG